MCSPERCPTLPVADLCTWHIGFVACGCAGLYSESGGPGSLAGHLRYGTTLCRVVHEDELRFGTFLGYSREPDAKLQVWGHHVPARDAAAEASFSAGQPVVTRPESSRLLAGDLTFAQLYRNSGRKLVPDVPEVDSSALSGVLLLIDHSLDWTGGRTRTELWYSTPAYEASGPYKNHRLVHRLAVAGEVPMVPLH